MPTTAAAGLGCARRQYDAALADFDEALRLDPKSVYALHSRGLTRSGMAEYDRAIAEFDEAIRLDPNHAWAYTNRGWAWR